MKKPPQSQHSAAALLPLADMIQGYARRLENLATWRDTLLRNSDAQAAGEHLGMAALLREIQALRFAGVDADVGFFIVCHMAERHAETIFETDRKLNELSAKLRAIEKREGLGELDEFDPDHPETPADWKVLDAKSNRRFEAVEKIEHDRIIGWLRRHGEFDMADLFANDREAFEDRREAGRCKVHGPMPDLNAAIGAGDAGLTEVVTNDK
jgi:hypothetical protein